MRIEIPHPVDIHTILNDNNQDDGERGISFPVRSVRSDQVDLPLPLDFMFLDLKSNGRNYCMQINYFTREQKVFSGISKQLGSYFSKDLVWRARSSDGRGIICRKNRGLHNEEYPVLVIRGVCLNNGPGLIGRQISLGGGGSEPREILDFEDFAEYTGILERVANVCLTCFYGGKRGERVRKEFADTTWFLDCLI
jgi:hypothetical protein